MLTISSLEMVEEIAKLLAESPNNSFTQIVGPVIPVDEKVRDYPPLLALVGTPGFRLIQRETFPLAPLGGSYCISNKGAFILPLEKTLIRKRGSFFDFLGTFEVKEGKRIKTGQDIWFTFCLFVKTNLRLLSREKREIRKNDGKEILFASVYDLVEAKESLRQKGYKSYDGALMREEFAELKLPLMSVVNGEE